MQHDAGEVPPERIGVKPIVNKLPPQRHYRAIVITSGAGDVGPFIAGEDLLPA